MDNTLVGNVSKDDYWIFDTASDLWHHYKVVDGVLYVDGKERDLVVKE